jgi:DNA-binding NarL/FixJ family response regulator
METGAHQSDHLSEELTRREIEILRLIAAGLKNHEIADQLFISLHNVKRHISNLYIKMNVRNRTEALKMASESGLL